MDESHAEAGAVNRDGARVASSAAAARRHVLIASGGGFLGLYLELSVVPYIAARQGGHFAAGVLTFALMATTVAMQALIPFLLRRFSPRTLFAAGLLLAGAPTLLYALSQSVAGLVAVTLVRGAGFGLITVLGSALVGSYSTPGSRGTALGAYGAVASVWTGFAPALGVAISRSSELAIFILGAIPPLVGMLALIPRLPPATAEMRSHQPWPGGLRALAPSVIVFTAVAAALAAAFTYVPLLRTGSTLLLLILFGAGFTTGRLLSGHLLDQGRSPTVLLLWLLGGIVIGLVLLGTSKVPAVAVGAAASGVGIGCVCTATLVMMLDRAGDTGVARASVVWNMAYDVGQAIGAIAFGLVASLFQPSGVFIAAAGAVALLAGPAAAFDWRRERLRVEAAI